MRVDVVCSSRELFGSDRAAVRLAKVLDGLGHEPRLVLPAGRPERGLSALAGDAGVQATAAPVTVASRRGVEGVAGLLQRRGEPADLAIFNTSAVLATAAPARKRMLILREWLDPRSPRHRALAALQARRVEAVVPISRLVSESWNRVARSQRAADVIPDWLDDEWLGRAAAPGRREGIVFLGRLSERKGPHVLCDAYERAFNSSAQRPTLRLVGDEGGGARYAGYAEELRRRSAANGFEILPFTRRPQDVLARASLLVVPSLVPEPFGDILLEALAVGCRVIAFRGGGANDLAGSFDDALEVIDPSDDALTDALERWWAAGAPAQAPATYERSCATLAAHYSDDAAAGHWERALARLNGA